MGLTFALLCVIISTVNAEFLIPTDKFGAGLTRISKQENAQVDEECGIQPGLNKINAGTIAKRGQFPWAVAIETSDSRRICSGTIISQRHVLTAAHCLVRPEFLNQTICQNIPIGSESEEISKSILGGYVAYGGNCNFPENQVSWNETGSPCTADDMTVRRVRKSGNRLFISHTLYAGRSRVMISAVSWEKRYRDRPTEQKCTNFDIAIIEVARDFHWGDFVRPACLLRNDLDYNEFTGSFSGFGAVKIGKRLQFFPDLRYGTGKILRRDSSSTLVVAPKRMERSRLEEEGTSEDAQVEQGDSGGGIVMKCDRKSILVGVSTEALSKEKKSRGAQVHPHAAEICELTGVCPIEDHCGING